MPLAWILVIIGLLLALLGYGGSVTLKTDGKFVITGTGGLVLMVIGVILWSAGI